ncbi:MAG: hypothetical protein WEE89_03045 [Gemmatimonadota bacterium]
MLKYWHLAPEQGLSGLLGADRGSPDRGSRIADRRIAGSPDRGSRIADRGSPDRRIADRGSRIRVQGSQDQGIRRAKGM